MRQSHWFGYRFTLYVFTPLVALLTACTTAPPAPKAPADLDQRVAALGRLPTPDVFRATVGLYAPLHSPAAAAGLEVSRDVKYGADERQHLTVFQAGGSDARPALLFVPGGAFVAGETLYKGTPFYDNIGVWAAKNGMVGVTMAYRLAPKFPYPAGAQDIGAAVSWLRANAKTYGIDPDRIYLMGHSAGAIHAATYVAKPELHAAGGVGVAGVILVSGLYDMSAAGPAPTTALYYGNDPAVYAERSPLAGLKTSKLPLMLAVADLDLPDFEQQTIALWQALCARDKKCPRLVWLPDHSHFSEVLAINTEEGAMLTDQIAEFVRKGR